MRSLDKIPSPEMLIDRVDEQNRVRGKILRKDIFTFKANFRTVHVLVLNRKGEILLQQQSKNRPRNPLSWGSSVAGYLFAGETYKQAALRRTAQELGFIPDSLHRVGIVKMVDQGCTKFVGVYTCVYDGPIHIDESHTSQTSFVSTDSISTKLKNDSSSFTETFRLIWECYIGSNA